MEQQIVAIVNAVGLDIRGMADTASAYQSSWVCTRRFRLTG